MSTAGEAGGERDPMPSDARARAAKERIVLLTVGLLMAGAGLWFLLRYDAVVVAVLLIVCANLLRVFAESRHAE